MNKHQPPHGPSAFAEPDHLAGVLSARATTALLAAAGDVTLVLDDDGTVIDVAVPKDELQAHGVHKWIGRSLIDTVSIESKHKVSEMVAEAGAAGRWRQVNHITEAGELPIRYLLMRVSAAGGDGQGGGRLVAIGRDMTAEAEMQNRLLNAQQSIERDYVRLRQAESRYRLLFDMAPEPVLIVDADTWRVREANPAARRLLGNNDGALADLPVSSIVEAAERDRFIAHLGAAGAADDLAPITLRLNHGHGAARVSARLFRQGRLTLLLIRVVPLDALPDMLPHAALIGDVLEHMPDAFVLADTDMTILSANGAFLELTEAPSLDRVIGMPLGTWLGRPGIDVDLMVAQLREHGAVRNVATILRGSIGAEEDVEVSGVIAPRQDGDCYGFAIRPVARRQPALPALERDLPRSVEQLTELVGRMSLKEIVRESADLIERLCIEAALAYTSDNRASAAEVLGLSRQSLYSKMHRYGLGNLSGNSDS